MTSSRASRPTGGPKLKANGQQAPLPAAPEVVHRAMMNSVAHPEVTGDEASGSSAVGGTFHAYGGCIEARSLELVPGRPIRQEWRTPIWPDGYPPSVLEISLQPNKGGTRLATVHSQVPEEQADAHAEAWREHYWDKLGPRLKRESKKSEGHCRSRCASSRL